MVLIQEHFYICPTFLRPISVNCLNKLDCSFQTDGHHLVMRKYAFVRFEQPSNCHIKLQFSTGCGKISLTKISQCGDSGVQTEIKDPKKKNLFNSQQ